MVFHLYSISEISQELYTYSVNMSLLSIDKDRLVCFLCTRDQHKIRLGYFIKLSQSSEKLSADISLCKGKSKAIDV